MCGIYLSLDRTCDQIPSNHIQDLLKHRGPDIVTQLRFDLKPQQAVTEDRNESPVTDLGSEDLTQATSKIHISCVGSVLSLRGDRVTKQPVLQDSHFSPSTSSFLCWNGEAWSFASTPIRGSDTAHVFDLLSYICETSSNAGDSDPEVAISEALSSYAGPYAFAYFDHHYQRIYCGRDFLGRRSLMTRQTPTGILVSSIPDENEDWVEIEADGVYWLDLKQQSPFRFEKEPYEIVQSSRRSSRSISPCELQLERRLPDNPEETITSMEKADPVDCLHHLLHSALKSRLLTIPTLTPLRPPQADTQRTKLAVLFSGGVDCTVLARLAHTILQPDEPIDLINVAFENPRVHHQSKAIGQSPYEQCPDRKTAATSLRELRSSCPDRNFRLVKVDVPYTEFLKHRPKVIALIKPHNTEMDLSIAAALYFAARGFGVLEDDSLYETSARVLLSGLGADELFAGYTRHATAYSRGGLKALEDELALDISRLGKRNLGRDDRVISHWAKEARYPFLDESLVKWALSATLFEKCGFGNTELPTDDEGASLDPAKMIIRRLAMKLGMPGVAQEKKRAIQFGARTAKMDVKKTKGTQVLTVMAH
ncbi:hypothetical protein KVT40_006487 [Elsinoe batatas]|uniref:Asparagine synthetase domain-containing protein n=1 Tax=Elsinoe batatas TaxID=2601811 RepID=A0A8K0PDU6_9PEZI|nr:hypothetical protein KVT40_006487 [Elsinoe batatas]